MLQFNKIAHLSSAPRFRARVDPRTLSARVIKELLESRCEKRPLSQLSYEPIIRFPCRLVYIIDCRCHRLKKYIDFNPMELERGSLNEGRDLVEEEYADIGEVHVAPDGLIYPKDPCKFY